MVANDMIDTCQVIVTPFGHLWPKSIGSYFSLSVYDITANEMIDTCHSHLVANGNSLQVRAGSSISLV